MENDTTNDPVAAETDENFARYAETAPLAYTSPNRPEKRDVIGTAVLGQLNSDRSGKFS